MSPGARDMMAQLVRTFETGSSGYEISAYRAPRESRWYTPALKHLRALVAYGYAEEVKAYQKGFRAFRATPRGIARHDITQHLEEEA